ncbi:hypothetical protein [Sphingomonas sp. LaA6.9]|uniref:hypothetical protein n=1 Tax=Sphingomonas sp. LaA6.9 TaxID=2919914 RepID=UPI001F4F816F|nr:hypothetical protein [Sphingomonas sp. LaA6.9]MCJ8159905.1 hypothetical protein [Sphingomonas sp. LaA6.9]
MIDVTELPRRVAIAIIGIVIVAMILIFAIRGCANGRQDAAQARQDAKGSAALSNAAKGAVGVVVARQGAEANIDAIVDQASKEIENAPNPAAARAATLNAVCQLRLYRERPECQVQRTGP